jgi:hypothetical protein
MLAATCNELISSAERALEEALYGDFELTGELPKSTAGGHLRLAPSRSLLKKLELAKEIYSRLRAVRPICARLVYTRIGGVICSTRRKTSWLSYGT